jgi:hypothetical protein
MKKITKAPFGPLTIAIILLAISACASKEPCPDVIQEPVSLCRAKQECNGSSTGSKILHGIALALGGMGAGMSGNPNNNAAAAQERQCIDSSLSSQRANAGLPSNALVCESEKISDTETITHCRPN